MNKIKPPSYAPTDDEIKLAHARHAFESDIMTIVDDLVNYYHYRETQECPLGVTPEQIKQHASIAVKLWNESIDHWDFDSDFWELFVTTDKFNTWIEALDTVHCGDCISVPATCIRCYAEDLFKIPNTANWDKSTGYKLFLEYCKQQLEPGYKQYLDAIEHKGNCDD